MDTTTYTNNPTLFFSKRIRKGNSRVSSINNKGNQFRSTPPTRKMDLTIYKNDVDIRSSLSIVGKIISRPKLIKRYT
jgi:hypothetical protein